MSVSRETFAIYATAKAALHAIIAELHTQSQSYFMGQPADPAVLRSAQGICGALRRLMAAMPEDPAFSAFRALLVAAVDANEAFILAALRGDDEATTAADPRMTEARQLLDDEQARLLRVLSADEGPPPQVVAAA